MGVNIEAYDGYRYDGIGDCGLRHSWSGRGTIWDHVRNDDGQMQE